MTETLYVFAPLQGEPVLAGRLDWRDGRGRFQYDAGWLADGYALDPRNLPLRPGPVDTTLNGGVHGVFADAGPDSWGRELILRERGQEALDNPLEALRLANGGGTGALLFSQSRTRPAPERAISAAATLDELEAAAQAIAAGQAVNDEAMRLLFEQGSGLGGARPKARITRDGLEYIAKFRRPTDQVDEPRMEWATLQLARMSGLDVPDHELVEINGRSVLLVQRFDRDGDARLHYLSMHALLSMRSVGAADVVAPRGTYSYFGAAAAYRRIGVPDAGPRMFERMLFNVLAGNTDDHTRNHGLLLREGQWDLAPAFDLVPQPSTRHGIGIGTEGRASTIDNAFSALPVYGIERARADAVYERMLEAFRSAPDILAESGLGEGDAAAALARMSEVVRAVTGAGVSGLE